MELSISVSPGTAENVIGILEFSGQLLSGPCI